MMETLFKVLTRKKVLDPVSTEQSELGRVLNTLDLTALGVGSTLGVGVYVLAGHVAKDTAGPAVVLSFLIATIASVFAGLCYAEFGARAPRAGSAYIYSYVCVGEFIAFVIGWNLILEYVIGSASVARGLSLYLDTLVNDTLKDTFLEIAPLGDISWMSKYFDFFAFSISVLLAVALAFGLKESSWANNIFTLVNLLVVGFVVIAGGVKSNTDNWHVNASSNCTYQEEKGCGGFFPFGVEGMIKGAATCFYGFVGFDCIATTGEEVKNPKRAIPFAIVLSLSIIFLAYFGTSTVVTLMIPYYDQDANAPLPHAFESVGLDWAKWVVAIGAIFGLCASLFGAMFPLPRIIYAMASDNVIFNFLGRVSQRYQTPVIGTLLAGLLTGLMAALFELKQLVNMMSIGTLLAYTIVAASVLLLRYQIEKDDMYQPLLQSLGDSDTYTENRGLNSDESNYDMDYMNDEITTGNVFKNIFNCGRQEHPSEISQKIVKYEVCLYCLLCIGIGLCVIYLKDSMNETWALVITLIIVCLTVLVVISMTTQPKSSQRLSFKVPLVPLIPALSILINIYLMLMLDRNTWIRFGVWMAVGIPTYYFSVQTPSDARNESISSQEISVTSTHGKSNGLINNGFVNTESEIKKKKAQAPPPPPPPAVIEETIAELDKVLEKEEANIIASEDDKINDRKFSVKTIHSNDRKFSADSLSNASNVLCEENVQAVVHCSDVPLSESFPVNVSNVSKFDIVSSPSNEETVKAEDQAKIELITERENDEIIEEKKNIPEVKAETNDIKSSQAIDTEKDEIEKIDEKKENKKIEEKDQNKEETRIEKEEVDSSISNKDEDKDDTKNYAAPTPTPPPPPPLLQSDKLLNNDVRIPRPQYQSDDFNNVKLKHINKPPETPPVDYSRENSEVAPQDDNLKFGTPEHKKFIAKLSNQISPAYIPLSFGFIAKKTLIPIPKKPIPVNENVILEKIDRSDAKEKLAAFLAKDDHVQSIVNGVKSEIKQNRISNVDRIRSKENEDIDRLQHKQNMDNIFRSIRLRKVDSFKSNESQ